MKIACQICDVNIAKDIYNLFTDNDNDTDNAIRSAIINLAPRLNETAFYCKFSENAKNCSDFLFPVITDEGVCYTFNLLNDLFTDE